MFRKLNFYKILITEIHLFTSHSWILRQEDYSNNFFYNFRHSIPIVLNDAEEKLIIIKILIPQETR